MQYGICPLSIVPLRAEPKNTSEQTSQLLYGEFFCHFKLSKNRGRKIQNESDGYEGWINNKHFNLLKKYFSKLKATKKKYSADLIDFIWRGDDILFPTPIGVW